MTTVLHTFNSSSPDNADPEAIQPSHWNAGHTVVDPSDVTLTNSTGFTVANGQIVILQNSGTNIAIMVDADSTLRQIFVAVVGAANGSPMTCRTNGATSVYCSGAVTVGHYLVAHGASNLMAKDSGVSQGSTTPIPSGAFAVALTTTGGAGLCSAQLLGHTHSASADADLTAHLAAPDPHAQYQKESDKGAAFGYAGLTSAAIVPIAQLATGTPTGSKFLRDDNTLQVPPAADLTAHLADADPHTGYQKESEKGGAHGYAGLNASALVPVAQLGTGTPTGDKFLRDDNTFAVPPSATLTAHVAAVDPHTGYQKESEKGAAAGYAGLNGSALVPPDQLGVGTATELELLTGDEIWKRASALKLIATGTTTPRTLGTRAAEVVNVRDMGAAGDGVTNDQPAFQAAIDLAQAGGGKVRVPAGAYLLSSGLSITATLAIEGDNRNRCFIISGAANMEVIAVNCIETVAIEKLYFIAPGGDTGGFAIRLTAATFEQTFPIIRDCTFADFFIPIHSVKTVNMHIDNCYFFGYRAYGVWVENVTTPDTGDSKIMGCTFITGVTETVGVLQTSSGGLRITNNKFLNGGWGFLQNLDAGAVTGVLVISDNSMEHHTHAAIEIGDGGSGATFIGAVIHGNHINNAANGIVLNHTSHFINGVNIASNQIQYTTGVGIHLKNVEDFNVGANNIWGTGAGTGIAIQSGCARGVISRQGVHNNATDVSVAGGLTDVINDN